MGKRSWNQWKKEKKENKSRISTFANWKKEGEAEVWIHTTSGMYTKVKHTIPYVKIDKQKDDNGDDRNVTKLGWYNFTCHEDEETIRYKNSPTRCPLDLFVEWLLLQDDVDDDAVVWECIVSKRDDKFNKRLTKYDITKNWRDSFKGKIKSVLPIIDNSNPTEILVSEESPAIENGIMDAIKKREEELDRYNKDLDLADPHLNPYPFLWKFNPKATKPADYYTVIGLFEIEPTKEIKALLESEPVDLTGYTKPTNPKFLRKIMEDHIVIEDVPFDDLFANAIQSDDDSFNYGENVKEEKKKVEKEEPKKKTKKTKKVKKKEPEPEPEEDDEEDEEKNICDACNKEISDADLELDECPFCGTPFYE